MVILLCRFGGTHRDRPEVDIIIRGEKKKKRVRPAGTLKTPPPCLLSDHGLEFGYYATSHIALVMQL